MEKKRSQICLVKAENEVHSGAMDKFSNEKQANFKLFNLCKRFFTGFKIKGETIFSELKNKIISISHNSIRNYIGE